MRTRAAALILLVAAVASAGDEKRVPNDFFAAKRPTFVVGTAGDEESDRRIRAQVDLIRGMLFPDAPVVADTSIDLDKGPEAWPADPVLYGGPHVNAILKRLEKRLPFTLEKGRLAIGGETFTGDEYRIIAAVPGRPAEDGEPAFPPFLLYAGTGTPGVAEINGVSHGPTAFVVADRFGPLLIGRWFEDGAQFLRRGRRLPWRTREVRGTRISRLQLVPDTADEQGQDTAIAAGLEKVAGVLGRGGVREVHVYPDRGSKRTITLNAGDGHADPNSGTLHILPFPAPALTALVAHEATHIVAYERWGPAGTPLMAEGLAVWVAGSYGGRPLSPPGSAAPALEDLLHGFRRLPEARTYPAAGLFTGELLKTLGEEKVRNHLYPATPATWAAACRAAGTTPEKVAAAYRRAVGLPR